jgi:putative SOS response-associated peptidase YedK
MACILNQSEVDIWLNRELSVYQRLSVLKPEPNDLLEAGWLTEGATTHVTRMRIISSSLVVVRCGIE